MTAGRRIPLLALPLACILLCGCRNHSELLENELRHKEALYRDALVELKRIEAQNEALMREIGVIRNSGGPVLPPEVAGPMFGLRRITLGRGSGGYDNDNLPGDETLLVIVEPRDGEEHVVKVPGSLHVTAIEIDAQGLKTPLCWWSLTTEQLAPYWKQGLLSTGYAVMLPWAAFPHCETVRVVAQFKLADGRCFEADKDVRVRLLPFPAPAPAPVPQWQAPPAPQWQGPPPAPQWQAPPPTPFVMPTAGVESAARWSPTPLTDAVEMGPPRPLSGPLAPVSIGDP
jgi:hypothetical protein